MVYDAISNRLNWAKPALRRVPGCRALAKAAAYILDPEKRAEANLRMAEPEHLFQISGITKPDRYPVIFDRLAGFLAPLPAPRVLSFGCSTGEEVAALGRRLATARITGMDINPRSIRLCRSRVHDPRFEFIHAGAPLEWMSETFDAICCLAVLQRGAINNGDADTCLPHLSFQDFEAMITRLDRCLRPGGYLAIHHTNFLFASTAIGRDYKAVVHVEPKHGQSPKFDASNRRVSPPPRLGIIFQKPDVV